MKCEQCLSSIEKYFEGELDERSASFITAHLAGCATCAKAYDELQREQEMYAAFLSEIRESPTLWSAVRAGIEKETAVSGTQPAMPTRSWFSGLSYSRFGLAFGLALAIIGVSIGLARHLWSPRNTSDNLASSPGRADQLRCRKSIQPSLSNQPPPALKSEQAMRLIGLFPRRMGKATIGASIRRWLTATSDRVRI